MFTYFIHLIYLFAKNFIILQVVCQAVLDIICVFFNAQTYLLLMLSWKVSVDVVATCVIHFTLIEHTFASKYCIISIRNACNKAKNVLSNKVNLKILT